MTKKMIALLMALAMMVAMLAGCGDKGEQKNQQEQTDELSSKYAYLVEYVPIDTNDISYVNQMCLSGEKVYLVAEYISGKDSWTDEETGEVYEYDTYSTGVFETDLTGKTLTKLSNYVPTVENGNYTGSYIQNIQAMDDGGFVLTEYVYETVFDLPEGFDEETMSRWDYYVEDKYDYYFHTFDGQGSLVSTSKLADFGAEYVSTIITDSQGNIYVTDWESVYVLDSEGKLKHTLGSDVIGNMNNLSKISDSEVGVSMYDENYENLTFKIIDPATGTLDEEIPLSMNAYNLYPGIGDYRYCYNYNGKIFGYNEISGESEKVLDWMEYDINSNYVNNYTMLEDGRVAAFSSDWSGEKQKNELIILTPTDPENIPKKQEITFACMYLDWELRNKIIEFNKKNSEYRIVVRDYSEYATEEDYNAGITKLNTEIISGKVPDMLYTSQLPIDRYGAQGILEDLWTYIDNDPELSREDLMTEVLDAMSVDGKLYQITSNFNIRTAVVISDLVGDKTTWTLEEMRQALASLPEGATIFHETATKSDMLYSLLSMNLDNYINWSTGQCSFDSADFISMLEFVGSFADDSIWDEYDWDYYESDYERMRNGKQLMTSHYLYSFDSMQELAANFGNMEVTMIGYPSETGSGSVFQVNDGIAISSSSEYKDIAWDFIRQDILEENQLSDYYYNGFPINRAAFEDMAEKAMEQEYDENGEPVPMYEYWMDEETTVKVYAMTQEQYDSFMELYRGITNVNTYNEEVFELIQEEAEGFFAGQTTAEETAKMIQSRVGLYVAEQM